MHVCTFISQMAHSQSVYIALPALLHLIVKIRIQIYLSSDEAANINTRTHWPITRDSSFAFVYLPQLGSQMNGG